MDNSAVEIYHPHIKEIVAAYSRANTKEGADRKLGVQTLWMSAGRSGEPGYLAYAVCVLVQHAQPQMHSMACVPRK